MKGSLARLFGLFVGISAVFIIVGLGVTIRNVLVVRSALTNVTDETLQRVELSGRINTDLFRGLSAALTYVRTRSAGMREQARTEIAAARQLTEKLGTIETGVTGYDDGDTTFAQLQQQRETVLAEVDPAITELVRAVDSRDQVATDNALARVDRVTRDIELLEEQTSAVADAAVADASQTSGDSVQAVFISLGVIVAILVVVFFGALVVVQGQVTRPLAQLVSATRRIGDGTQDAAIPVTARFEVGALQHAFGQMVRNLQASQAQIAEHQRSLEARVDERTAEATRAVADLQASLAERDQLLTTVRQLASPVIPVAEGVLVMPLVGVLDTARADTLQQALLEAVQQHRARTVMLDVTGVPLIDTDVARTLLDVSAAVRLLGARTLLVGLRPELAQTIVGLGLDLRAIETAADLQSGLRSVLGRRHADLKVHMA